MSYTKTQWVDNSAPAINADNLNHIEQGIYDAHDELGDKVDKETGKGLSTNDFTDAEKTKLAGIDLSTKQDTLISGTNIKTVNSTSLLGSGDVSVQETLISGTNIKTINNNSLLGSGNIVIQGGGGGSTVAYNPTVTSGTELGKINIDGTDNAVYAPPVPSKTSDLTNDSGFISTETDPVYSASAASGISSSDITNWNEMCVLNTTTYADSTATPSDYSATITVESTENDASFPSPYGMLITYRVLNARSMQLYYSTINNMLYFRDWASNAWTSWAEIATKTSTTVTISVANWSASTTCAKSVTGVTASNNVIVTPAPASIADWQSSGVYCSAQGSGTLTFTCKSTPTASIDVNVLVIN